MEDNSAFNLLSLTASTESHEHPRRELALLISLSSLSLSAAEMLPLWTTLIKMADATTVLKK